MLPADSPFPCSWWGTDLGIVGLEDVRPHVGTYGRYAFDQLPALPFEMYGDWLWLLAAPVHADSIDRDYDTGADNGAKIAEALTLLREAAARIPVKLPKELLKFLEMPALQQRIRSNTGCFLDLCPELVRSPVSDGYLIRFLADSQACLFWYVYLTSSGSDHAVVASADFYGTEAEAWQEEPLEATGLAYCAESFEAFLCRFWLENEIWFSAFENTPMPDSGREYIARYQSAGE